MLLLYLILTMHPTVLFCFHCSAMLSSDISIDPASSAAYSKLMSTAGGCMCVRSLHVCGRCSLHGHMMHGFLYVLLLLAGRVPQQRAVAADSRGSTAGRKLAVSASSVPSLPGAISMSPDTPTRPGYV